MPKEVVERNCAMSVFCREGRPIHRSKRSIFQILFRRFLIFFSRNNLPKFNAKHLLRYEE